jgi:hypothetical protein
VEEKAWKEIVMSTVISARNLRVEKNADGIEMAYVTIDVQSWDGSFHFEVGVRNPVLAADVLDELRARLLLLFQAAYQELERGPLQFREIQ